MTGINVKPGICGFETAIYVSKHSRNNVKIEIKTQCEFVQEFAKQVRQISWKDALTRIDQSIIYKEAAKTIKHTACPIPMVVLKAIEVEIGVALPENITIEFCK